MCVCVLPLVLYVSAFGFNHTGICPSVSHKNSFIQMDFQAAQQKVFKGNEDIRRKGKSTARVTVKGQS